MYLIHPEHPFSEPRIPRSGKPAIRPSGGLLSERRLVYFLSGAPRVLGQDWSQSARDDYNQHDPDRHDDEGRSDGSDTFLYRRLLIATSWMVLLRAQTAAIIAASPCVDSEEPRPLG
jgi:hypothetical protein